MIGKVCTAQGASRHPDWQSLYVTTDVAALPWHNAALDEDLATELESRGIKRGKVLDLGTGTGTQARQLADAGFRVVGTDIAPAAIALAELGAPKNATFVVDDICATRLDDQFDLAVDVGCLHVLPAERQPGYAASVSKLVRAGGFLFLKCFSAEEPDPGFGPMRFTLPDLDRALGAAFQRVGARPTTFKGPRAHQPKAWFTVYRRLSL